MSVCQTCGAEEGRRMAFFRNGPWDQRLVEMQSYPTIWEVPYALTLDEMFSEEGDLPDYPLSIRAARYDLTNVVFKGARVYAHQGDSGR